MDFSATPPVSIICEICSREMQPAEAETRFGLWICHDCNEKTDFTSPINRKMAGQKLAVKMLTPQTVITDGEGFVYSRRHTGPMDLYACIECGLEIENDEIILLNRNNELVLAFHIDCAQIFTWRLNCLVGLIEPDAMYKYCCDFVDLCHHNEIQYFEKEEEKA